MYQSQLRSGFKYPTVYLDRPSLQLFYLDAPIAPPESLALAVAGYLHLDGGAVRARADSLVRLAGDAPQTPVQPSEAAITAAMSRALGIADLVPIRCPVLCAPRYAPYLDALGLEALVDLMGRLPGTGGR